MSALRSAVSWLWSCAQWLDYAGSRCDSIPVVGTAVGYPLHTAANALYNTAQALDSADRQLDSLVSQVSQAYYSAQQALNAVWGTVWQTAQSALSQAQSAYNFAAGTVWQAAQSALSTANNAYNFAAGYLVSAIGDVRRTLDYGLSRLDTAIWQAIRDWQAGYDRLQAQISQAGSYILSGADVVGWVRGSLDILIHDSIVIVGTSASTFADPLWWCADQIVGKLTEYRR